MTTNSISVTVHNLQSLMNVLYRLHPMATVAWDRDTVGITLTRDQYGEVAVDVYSESFDWDRGDIISIHNVKDSHEDRNILKFRADPVPHFYWKWS